MVTVNDLTAHSVSGRRVLGCSQINLIRASGFDTQVPVSTSVWNSAPKGIQRIDARVGRPTKVGGMRFEAPVEVPVRLLERDGGVRSFNPGTV